MSASSGQNKQSRGGGAGNEPPVITTRPNLKSIYFNNNGLFAENYLVNRLPNEAKDSFILEHWETEPLPEFNECYEWMLSTWEEYKDIFPGLSEAQLEAKWIRPILERLGWTYEVQERLQRRGKIQIPDYSLFDSVETYKKAKGCANNEKYFSFVQAVADAKAMGIDLDGKGRTNANPSYQIVRYMEDTDTQWGILTDGEYWRLYSTKSKSQHTTFYEVNIRKVLSGRGKSSRDDFGFKYFFNFFRKASFAERDAAGKSFLDVVYESGERYAREVETQLKQRAFHIVESIARGFCGDSTNLGEQELAVIYQHSLYYLFRLLFILNCESRGILDVNDFANYFPHSIRSIAHRLKDEFERNTTWSGRPKVYDELAGLFDLLERGDKAIKLFPFGKDLFSSGDRDFFKKRKIPDQDLNRAIVELACAYSDDGELQFIDYGRLGPDHIGSVFEGLLEYSLKYADRDYYVDKKGKIHELGSEGGKQSKNFELIRKGTAYLSTGTGERKSSGAYYTPDHVVDYIVERTLDPICSDLNPNQMLALKVCDPAMGSGHFLIGAIRYLEKRILAGLYATDEKAADIDPGEVRWKILHNCVFGVDLNPIAVELAKFSLWIFSVRLGHELEPLGSQLKTGNSLIGKPRILSKHKTTYRGPEFNWEEEFATVWKRREKGFDAIVGNPPYIRIQILQSTAPDSVDYYKGFYRTAETGNCDIYVAFVERGLQLLSDKGRQGFILPSKFIQTDYGAELRDILVKNESIDSLIDFGHSQVFEGVSTYTCLLFLTKEPIPEFQYVSTRPDCLHSTELKFSNIVTSHLSKEPWVLGSSGSASVLKKLETGTKILLDVPVEMSRGSSTGADEVYFVFKDGNKFTTKDGKGLEIETEILRQPIHARSFGRFRFSPQVQANEFVIFPYKSVGGKYALLDEAELKKRYPKAFKYLSSKRKELEARKQYGEWFGYSAARNLDLHDQAQLLVPLLADKGLCGPIKNNKNYCLMASAGFSITILAKDSGIDPNFLAGMVNSNLLFWYLRQMSNKFRGGWITCTKQYFGKLPIKLPTSSAGGAKFEKQIVQKVEQLVKLNSAQKGRNTSQESVSLETEINNLIYSWYGLTNDEKQLIEAELRSSEGSEAPTADDVGVA